MIMKRIIQKQVEQDFFKGKVIIVAGARQVGKSTLLDQLGEAFSNKKILKIRVL